MAKDIHVNLGLLAELQNEPWVMSEVHLQNFLTHLGQLAMKAGPIGPDEITKAKAVAEEKSGQSRMKVENGRAIIPISGILVKNPSWIYDYFGVDYTSYEQISRDINTALDDGTVDTIYLHISSPGGYTTGVAECAETIYSARERKNCIAFIEDMGCSGAYWLASQAETIYANQNAEVGSIGVYTVLYDTSAMAEKWGVKVHVLKSGEIKGTGIDGAPISKEQIAARLEIITDLADQFKAAVARGRGMEMSEVEKLATGKTWLAQRAVKNGLIDGVDTLVKVLAGGGQKTTNESNITDTGDHSMSGEKTNGNQAKTDPDLDKIKQEAAQQAKAEEQSRLKALQEAFANDSGFAVEQFQKGASVNDAKIAYVAVLEKKLAASDARVKELEAKQSANQGKTETATDTTETAAAIPQNGSGEGSQAADFMAMARARASEKKISVSAAMSEINRENPELHKAWLAKQTGK